jgi:hypothetical protein
MMAKKVSLAHNFEEAKVVEKELISLEPPCI